MITVDEVRTRVADIRKMAGDDEMAHDAEDRLYIAVLEAVAAGADASAEMAKIALESQKIKFGRWTA